MGDIRFQLGEPIPLFRIAATLWHFPTLTDVPHPTLPYFCSSAGTQSLQNNHQPFAQDLPMKGQSWLVMVWDANVLTFE